MKVAYKLNIDKTLITLPVTDLRHVCDEINQYRKLLMAINGEKRRRSEAQKKYRRLKHDK